MMIHTSRFGELECQEGQIIHFSAGIPGFKKYQQYMIVTIEDSPFQYLQSIDDGTLAFILVSPFEFYPEYEFELHEQIKSEMNIQSEASILIYNIVNVRGELATATINLAAPIIINKRGNIGVQYILSDDSYSIHQPLFAKSLPIGGE